MSGEGGPPLLHGARFSLDVPRDPDEVFRYLVDVPRTPEWRTHLTSVEWADEGPVRVGRRIRVVTSLLWYREVTMICEVTAYDPDARRFAYEVVEGPARSRNAYDVEATPGGARIVMQGAVPLDSWYLRLAGPLLKLAEDRITRGEMRRLDAILRGEGWGGRRARARCCVP
jgi:hypothetical protein